MSRRPRCIAVLVVLLVAATAPAAGQTTRPSPPDGTGVTTTGVPGLLAGPTVAAAAVEDRAAFGGRDGRRRLPAVPPRRWIEVVRGLDLSADQRREMRSILAELEDERRVFQRTAAPGLRELQRRARTARESGEPLPDEVREELARRQQEAPQIVAYQHRIWGELTGEQQSRMRRELADIRAGMTRRRGTGEGAGTDSPRRRRADDAPPSP